MYRIFTILGSLHSLHSFITHLDPELIFFSDEAWFALTGNVKKPA